MFREPLPPAALGLPEDLADLIELTARRQREVAALAASADTARVARGAAATESPDLDRGTEGHR